MHQQQFEEHGFFKDYFLNGKLIGSLVCDKDREVFGYSGRMKEIVAETIQFQNKKKIKAGSEVMTELNILCGKRLRLSDADSEIDKPSSKGTSRKTGQVPRETAV